MDDFSSARPNTEEGASQGAHRTTWFLPLRGPSLQKRKNPHHGRRLQDTLVIFLNFRDDRPENWLSMAVFEH